MKTTIYHLGLTLSLIVVFTLQLNACILTVASQSLPQVAQYNTIQAAHDAAQSGDTIYVYPSLIAYKGAVITKKMIIIGNGFTKVNDYSECSKILNSETLKFDAGSEGSVISSLSGNFSISVIASNVLVQRCKLGSVTVGNNATLVSIINSIISSISISDNSFVSILNNIINCGQATAIGIGTNGYGLIKNNIISNSGYSAIYGYSASVINNIFFTNSTAYYFLAAATIQNSPTNVDKDTWFVDFTNQNYHLKAGSPGIGAGKNNIDLPTDLGIYGGDYPFIDDGAPSLPTVYYMNIPSTASQKDGLSVEIKAKTNK